MKIGRFETHPAADVFPLMSEAELDELAEDVRDNGLLEPIWIVVVDGRDLIVDGRHRAMACERAGVEPTVRMYEGDDVIGFVLSMNAKRRHLSESQRAMVAAKIATLSRGRPELNPPIGGFMQPAAGTLLNVGVRSIQRAREVLTKAPEVASVVESGALTVAAAVKLASLDEPLRERAVDHVRSGLSGAEAYRKAKAEVIEKAEFEKPSGRYRVIYADPPWSYGNAMPPGTGVPTDHYPAMSLDEICQLPVKDLALDDAVLFLWTTSPHLRESFAVIDAWGFKYKTSFVWDKVKHNMGHYNSVRHEFLLVCTRGSCQPDVRKLFDSVYEEERTEHSRKPDFFYDVIDTIYPSGGRVELFARRERDGWSRWGYEADAA